jgi:hypothetical protein
MKHTKLTKTVVLMLLFCSPLTGLAADPVRSKPGTLTWAKPAPKTVWRSNLAEERGSKITGPIEMTAYEIVTLRVSPPGK